MSLKDNRKAYPNKKPGTALKWSKTIGKNNSFLWSEEQELLFAIFPRGMLSFKEKRGVSRLAFLSSFSGDSSFSSSEAVESLAQEGSIG